MSSVNQKPVPSGKSVVMKFLLVILGLLLTFFIVVMIFTCNKSTEYSGAVSTSTPSPQFMYANQNQFPDIAIGNYREEFDKWNGTYKLLFDVTNNSGKDIKFVQVDAVLYLEGGETDKLLTGNKLKKNETVTMYVNDITPKKPVRAVLTINGEMTELLSTVK